MNNFLMRVTVLAIIAQRPELSLSAVMAFLVWARRQAAARAIQRFMRNVRWFGVEHI